MALEPVVPAQDQSIEGIRINDAVSYEMYDDRNVRIHLLPMSADLSPRAKHNEFVKGMCMLATMIEKAEGAPEEHALRHVERINTVSWAIHTNPDILEMFKFTVDKDGVDALGKKLCKEYSDNPPKHIGDEYRGLPALYAFMDRGDFLAEYGSKSKKARKYGIQ